jgi:hypothetical protein
MRRATSGLAQGIGGILFSPSYISGDTCSAGVGWTTNETRYADEPISQLLDQRPVERTGAPVREIRPYRESGRAASMADYRVATEIRP